MQIHHGDCLDVLRSLPGESVDAIVTDPPYGFSFMGKHWDYDVPSVEIWAECLRALKPGGHLLAFAGTRTQHRMAVRIEDAGFEIRDMIAWVYGSGFPKSMDVSKAIDKAGGGTNEHIQAHRSLAQEIRAKREQAGVSRAGLASWFPEYSAVTKNWERTDAGFRAPTESAYSTLVERLGIRDEWRDMVRAEDLRRIVSTGGVDRRDDGTVYGLAHSGVEYAATTEAARQWQGWGTALKPALEPITVARKPLIGTVAENVLAHGTGALNIDGCRVASQQGENFARPVNHTGLHKGWDRPWKHDPDALARERIKRDEMERKAQELGRWPANLIHDGSEEVLAGFPSPHGAGHANYKKSRETYDASSYEISGGELFRYGDSGSAARFFYCAKASKRDRDEGLDTPPQPFVQFQTANGTSGKPSSLSEGRNTEYRNTHPTVKPTDLMRYLCRLVTPPGGVVLDPFMGSGSTGKAAVLEGFRFIGIEREAEYTEIAKARIAHVQKAPKQEALL